MNGVPESLLREVEFRVNTQGTAALADLSIAITDVEGRMTALATKMPANGQEAREMASDMAYLNAELGRLQQTFRAVDNALSGAGNVSVAALKRQEAAARAVLEISRGLEDFSMAGWRGALNNIPMLIMSIGQAAGMTATQVSVLTGGISILATLGTLVVQNWRHFQNFFTDMFTNPQRALDSFKAGMQGLGDGMVNAFSATFDNTLKTKVEILTESLKKAEDRTKDLAGQARLTESEMRELTYGRGNVERLKKALEEAKEAQELLKSASKPTRDAAAAFEEGVETVGGQNLGPMLEKALATMAGGKDKVLSNARLGLRGTPKEMVDALIGKASNQADPQNASAFKSILTALEVGGFGGTSAFYELATRHPDYVKAQEAAEKQYAQTLQEAKATQQKANDLTGPLRSKAAEDILARMAGVEAGGGSGKAVEMVARESVNFAIQQAGVPAELRGAASQDFLKEILTQYRSQRTASSPREIMAQAADPDALREASRRIDTAVRVALGKAVLAGLSDEEAVKAAEKAAFQLLEPELGGAEARNVAASLTIDAEAAFRSKRGGGDPRRAATAFIAESEAEGRSRKTALQREDAAKARAAERAEKAAKREDDAAKRERAQEISRFSKSFEGEVGPAIETAITANQLRNQALADMDPTQRSIALRQMRMEAAQYRKQVAFQRRGLKGEALRRFDEVAALGAPLAAPMSDEAFQVEMANRVGGMMQARGARDNSGDVAPSDTIKAGAEEIVGRSASDVSQKVTAALFNAVSAQEALAGLLASQQAELGRLLERQGGLNRALDGIGAQNTRLRRTR
jgi:hypothetical protein